MQATKAGSRKSLLGLRRRPGKLVAVVFGLMPVAYRFHLGRLFGHQFLLLEHRGRKTGQLRMTALKVADWDRRADELLVLSVYGTNAAWLRNIEARPALAVRVAGQRYEPTQRFLTQDEALAALERFRVAHGGQLRLFAAIFGWGSLTEEADARAFVRERPFVCFGRKPR